MNFKGRDLAFVRNVTNAQGTSYYSCREYIRRSGDKFEANGGAGDIAFWNNDPFGSCAIIVGFDFYLSGDGLERRGVVHEQRGLPYGYTEKLHLRD